MLGALFVQNGARVDLRRHHIGNAGREVRLDRAGDDINGWSLSGCDEVNTSGPRHLRKALNTGFNFFAGNHHQVGHLVDHDDDGGHLIERDFFGLIHRAAGIRFPAGLDFLGEATACPAQLFNLFIEASKVSDAGLGHHLIAGFHLPDGPLQRGNGFLWIDHDRREEMRNAFINGEFQHFRVDHDEAALFRWQLVHERQDHRIDADRFT